MNISPKVYVPTVLAILAGLALWLITGDETALIVSLTGLTTGGVAAVAPPAPGVKHSEVAAIARKRQVR
jgi:hypothetical protein